MKIVIEQLGASWLVRFPPGHRRSYMTFDTAERALRTARNYWRRNGYLGHTAMQIDQHIEWHRQMKLEEEK